MRFLHQILDLDTGKVVDSYETTQNEEQNGQKWVKLYKSGASTLSSQQKLPTVMRLLFYLLAHYKAGGHVEWDVREASQEMSVSELQLWRSLKVLKDLGIVSNPRRGVYYVSSYFFHSGKEIFKRPK